MWDRAERAHCLLAEPMCKSTLILIELNAAHCQLRRKKHSKYFSIQQPPLHASKLGGEEYIFIIVLHDNGFECVWAEEEQQLQRALG